MRSTRSTKSQSPKTELRRMVGLLDGGSEEVGNHLPHLPTCNSSIISSKIVDLVTPIQIPTDPTSLPGPLSPAFPLPPSSSLITRLNNLIPLSPHRPIRRQPLIPTLTILSIRRNRISRQRRARRGKPGPRVQVVHGRELAAFARGAGHGDGVCVWVLGAAAGGHAVLPAPDGQWGAVVAVECVGDVFLAGVDGGGEGEGGGEEEGEEGGGEHFWI